MAMTGRVGARLASLAGVDDLEERALRGNLVNWWPGPSLSGKGDHFPVHHALLGWVGMVPFLRGVRTIILGRATARVVGLDNAPWMRWIEVHPDYIVAVLPHPSGVVRWWNDAENVAAARDFLREVFV